MAVSETSIANAALTKLGEARITDLADETDVARVLNSRFEAVRDAELRKHRWKFAQKRAELAALVDAPAFGYAYQFELPDDFLRLDSIGEAYPNDLSDYRTSIDSERYRIEGTVILTDDAGPLPLRYGAKVTDPTKFDTLFVEALACKLAIEVCEKITQSNTKRQLAWDEYKDALREAVKVNALEKPPSYLADDSWILGRL